MFDLLTLTLTFNLLNRKWCLYLQRCHRGHSCFTNTGFIFYSYALYDEQYKIVYIMWTTACLWLETLNFQWPILYSDTQSEIFCPTFGLAHRHFLTAFFFNFQLSDWSDVFWQHWVYFGMYIALAYLYDLVLKFCIFLS